MPPAGLSAGRSTSCKATDSLAADFQEHRQSNVRTRPTHEYRAIRRLRRENYSNGRWDLGTIAVDLKFIWEMSVRAFPD
jgi:hypothetical protein